MNKSERVKIHFKVLQDDNGYPPTGVESLWAVPTKGGYRIDNVPFFVKRIAVDDEVTASNEENQLWFSQRIRVSKHSAVRVVLFKKELLSTIRSTLKTLGCPSELSHLDNLIAVDVPPEVDYRKVSKYLEELSASETADYEESALRHKY